jgi:spore germination cell wall hydrolase CwlJ-like protein
LFSLTQTRAEARALIGAVFVGAALGVAVGGAYMAGGIARDQGQHARIERLAGAAASGFSDSALRQTAAAMPPGVLAAARRHDPFTVAGGAERDRQAALLAGRLERPAAPVAAAGRIGPAAEPFRLTGALEQSRDLDCLSSAVYYEARGESAAGQAAVAQVVLNRVRHPAFPKTVCGVVFQGVANGGCQFSFACNGAMRRGKEPAAWARARDVAAKALGGHVMAEVGEAVNFHVASLGSVWGASMRRVGQVGSHVFYTFGGHGGSPGAFHGGGYAAEPRPDAAETVDRPIYAASPGAPTADGVPTAQLASAIVTIAPQPTAAKDTPAAPEAKPVVAKPSDSSAKAPSPSATAAAS